MGATKVAEHGARHVISIESQLIAIGSGFVVLIALAFLFVAVQQRRRRRINSSSSRDFHSPLIRTYQGKPNKFHATSGSFGSSGGSPILSPNESNSSSSPQCTPLTPYSSFSPAVSAVPPVICADNALQSQRHELNEDNGTISVTINYESVSGILQIYILACHNLPNIAVSNDGECKLNPYVKLRLLPNNQYRVKTRVLRGTRNPFYDEQFTIYGLTPTQLRIMSLHLAVLCFDQYSRDLVLGEAFLSLSDADCRTTNKNVLKLSLYPRPTYENVHAQVLLSMAYNKQTQNINVAVLKVKDLPCDEKIGLIDPYIKVYMLLNGQRIIKHKTHVKKHSTEAVFNESFAFDMPTMIDDTRLRVPAEILGAISFEIQLLNHDGVTRNELVGQCVIGANSRHWIAVQEQPGQQVAEWHKIHVL